MHYILGLNAFHADSSACLLKDGNVVAAAEEERFRRVKHWAGFPSESIRYCLGVCNLSVSDVDAVAINSDPAAARAHKLGYALSGRPSPRLLLEKIRIRKRRQSIGALMEKSFGVALPKQKIVRVEHHLSHLASAFFLSPFDEAAVLSLDGFGDFCSTAWGCGNGLRLTVDHRVRFPHSLGVFYQAMTQFLGFPTYGDEYKVMGLASYGRPRHLQQLSEVLFSDKSHTFKMDLRYFRHHRHGVGYEWNDGEPGVSDLFSEELEDILGPRRKPNEEISQRHKDIACSTQAVYEHVVFALINHLHQRYRVDELALAGGCAMNSVCNGKIYEKTPFRKTYVHPAAGDAGGAIGAALMVHSKADSAARPAVMENAFLGPIFSNEEIERVLEKAGAELRRMSCCVRRYQDEGVLIVDVSSRLAGGQVVGWFQGRMEWGPRALGNRSILCDPRRADAKELLNSKIKRREGFRPFAPSILREAVGDWFVQEDDVPFMEKVFEIKPAKRKLIPAVTHVDGSGRLQTVSKETNPRYYNLIKAFSALTGVPLLLNTSFNENEPIVCRPEEALDCFLRTNMDLLIMGDYSVSRTP